MRFTFWDSKSRVYKKEKWSFTTGGVHKKGMHLIYSRRGNNIWPGKDIITA